MRKVLYDDIMRGCEELTIQDCTSLLRIRKYTEENGKEPPCLITGYFYGDLGECKETLRMLLVCIDSAVMLLLCNLSEAKSCLITHRNHTV